MILLVHLSFCVLSPFLLPSLPPALPSFLFSLSLPSCWYYLLGRGKTRFFPPKMSST